MINAGTNPNLVYPYRIRVLGWLLVLALIRLASASGTEGAQVRVTTPLEEFGFNLGDDYQLANYSQLASYWQKLAAESDRMKLEVIGETAEGRPIYMAIITSPENHENLDRYKEISRRLALAEGVSESEARALAGEGRSVVWIDGGLHANETLGAQQLMELVYQMVSLSDPETLRFLDETILLAVCSNPDGLELVADWYMRAGEPEARSLEDLPRLYQKYAGHDNNRDFYMSALPETAAINRVLYQEWFPQIVYNHHQSGPRGTVLFAPPFRDPFNYNLDPLVVTSLDLVAGAMHSRFLAENKPGATMRSGATYSTWWNGGLRTSPYFHNMIGILTETIGGPTPARVPPVTDMQVPRGDYPAPVEPGAWHFAQSVDYSITANRAVLDVASRYRDTLLFNIWRMGMNSIERGSRDHWTLTPDDVARVEDAIGTSDPETVVRLLRGQSTRDPRGYIIPADQPDFLTAMRFVDALIKNGVTVERATDAFRIAGRSYPEGSFIVRTAQAFRPHIMDMFEPQDYPDDFAYPGASPTAPYDTTGWTLAYQMGVGFEPILDGFDGPFEPVADVTPRPGRVEVPGEAAGFFLGHAINEGFAATNRLLAVGEAVFWLSEEVVDGGRTYPPGTLFVRAGENSADTLDRIAVDLGLVFEAASVEPQAEALELRPVRIGLWDEYGGSETSGWTRFVLEDFEFPFDVVYAPRLDEGDLGRDFDVLIFPDGSIPVSERDGGGGRRPALEDELAAEYSDQIGNVTVAETVPELREFMELGGTIVSVGSATALARHLDLPVEDALMEPGADGDASALSADEFYVPGSILRAEVDSSHPIGYGVPDVVDVLFDESPAFRVSEEAAAAGVQTVAWFGPEPLRSGWAWGESVLDGAAAVVDAPVGDGRLVLFGPEVTFRAQSHGTFKFLFNSLYYGHAVSTMLGE